MDLIGILLEDAFWSALAAMGFALLFNVPRRSLIFCMFAGAIGHVTRTFCMEYLGLTIEMSSFFGAVVVGFWAKWCASRLKMPSMIFSVTGVIPMVPGKFAYITMMGVLAITTIDHTETTDVIQQIVTNGISTGMILGGLGLGIVLPVLFFNRTKPVV